MIALLLDGAVEIDVRDSGGQTPLMMAVVDGTEDHVRLLIAAGVALDTRDEDGRTP